MARFFIMRPSNPQTICYQTYRGYKYDFGDSWHHEVVLEEVTNRLQQRRYPSCLDGAQACPPEDCGGVWGYQEMLAVLRDPSNEEYESMLQWVGGKYDASVFSPEQVHFDDPEERWQIAFGHSAFGQNWM